MNGNTKKALRIPKQGDENVKSAWYVLYTSGQEDNVKKQIITRAKNMNQESEILEIYIPKKTTVKKLKSGKKQEKEVPRYKKYMFINMYLTDVTYEVVKNTPGVLYLIAQPLSSQEIARLFGRASRKFINQGQGDDLQYDSIYKEGNKVRIQGGAFEGFNGTIQSIKADTAVVLLEIFGGEEPVEIDLDYVHPA